MPWVNISSITTLSASVWNNVLNNVNYLRGRTSDKAIELSKPYGLPKYATDDLPALSPTDRAIAVDSTANKLTYWNGTVWTPIEHGGAALALAVQSSDQVEAVTDSQTKVVTLKLKDSSVKGAMVKDYELGYDKFVAQGAYPSGDYYGLAYGTGDAFVPATLIDGSPTEYTFEAGDGIEITGNVVIAVGEIDGGMIKDGSLTLNNFKDGAVDGDALALGGLTISDFDIENSGSVGDILSVNSAGTRFKWVSPPPSDGGTPSDTGIDLVGQWVGPQEKTKIQYMVLGHYDWFFASWGDGRYAKGRWFQAVDSDEMDEDDWVYYDGKTLNVTINLEEGQAMRLYRLQTRLLANETGTP